MAEQLLDRIRAEIRERRRTTEAAVREYERLQAALDVLGGAVEQEPQDTGRSAARSSSPRARRAATVTKRAARGANREAVLDVLGERPGVSVGELSTASGVAKPVLYGLLKALEQRREVLKEQLPGGTTGYRLPPPAPGQATAGVSSS